MKDESKSPLSKWSNETLAAYHEWVNAPQECTCPRHFNEREGEVLKLCPRELAWRKYVEYRNMDLKGLKDERSYKG